MHLEWSVILTQAVGFIVVMLLLRKFAWGKLMGFIDKRRETIEGQFADIERGQEEVEKLKGDFETQLANIEELRREKIQEAAQEANQLASDIKDEARQDAVGLREKAEHDIKLELDKANVQLRDRMVNAVIVAAEKVIRERLDSDKHKQLITDFLNDVSLGGGK
jgi:F-type H+-transporting ATPase subunit b